MEPGWYRQLLGSASQGPCLQALKAFYYHRLYKGGPEANRGEGKMELRALLMTHCSFLSELLCLAGLLRHVAGAVLLISATPDISSKHSS